MSSCRETFKALGHMDAMRDVVLGSLKDTGVIKDIENLARRDADFLLFRRGNIGRVQKASLSAQLRSELDRTTPWSRSESRIRRLLTQPGRVHDMLLEKLADALKHNTVEPTHNAVVKEEVPLNMSSGGHRRIITKEEKAKLRLDALSILGLGDNKKKLKDKNKDK